MNREQNAAVDPGRYLIIVKSDYRDDKPNPGYYARRTVTRAYAHLALSWGEDSQEVIRAIREHPPRPYDNGEQYARTVVEETLTKLNRSRNTRLRRPPRYTSTLSNWPWG